jgi:translin
VIFVTAMNNLEPIIDKIEKHIDAKDQVREKTLRYSRDIIIECRKAIQCLHQEQHTQAQDHIKQASKTLQELTDTTKDHPDLFHAGYVENAAQEYVEAQCLSSIMKDEDLPDPDSLHITYSSYLMCLCDVVGELRRGALDFMLTGKADAAHDYLQYMEKIYDYIIRFDYPSGLVPIKKRQDMIRGLIEKTRGELVVAHCERRIDDKTDEVRGLLDRITQDEKKNSKPKKEDVDIDIDKVW